MNQILQKTDKNQAQLLQKKKKKKKNIGPVFDAVFEPLFLRETAGFLSTGADLGKPIAARCFGVV